METPAPNPGHRSDAETLLAALKTHAGLVGLAALAIFTWAYWDGLEQLVFLWSEKEEYSHGWLIGPLAIALLWTRRHSLLGTPGTGRGWGVVALAMSSILLVIGELSALYVIVHYSMVLCLWGLFITVFGLNNALRHWPPLIFLLFMVPIPPLIYNQISSWLQLLSSELGVAFIRACSISVYLEGNVIDLGHYQLQVVEACNGLRYLFPLMSFGFICAVLFVAPVWQRTVVFLSTIPITVLMNSFRIGVIGVLVEYWGIEMAEGFLHDFEGWLVFMLCVGVLMGEMWLLTWLTRRGVPFSAVFWPRVDDPGAIEVRALARPTATAAAAAILTSAAAAAFLIGEREAPQLTREHLTSFPTQLAEWEGQRSALEPRYLEALKLSDYILANFRKRSDTVNLYVAYYESQRKGEAAHSPRSCIPGGGWEIEAIEEIRVDGTQFHGQDAVVNRVTIRKGQHRQLVYYWFQQRGRVLASEYEVKAYMVWDALAKNRTDGALVRLTTSVGPGEEWADGDERLRGFMKTLSGRLDSYVPS